MSCSTRKRSGRSDIILLWTWRIISPVTTRVIKFFLHLSREEQRKRFLYRIDEPEKNWKFSLADIAERKFWNDYMKAYEECLSATSTRVDTGVGRLTLTVTTACSSPPGFPFAQKATSQPPGQSAVNAWRQELLSPPIVYSANCELRAT